MKGKVLTELKNNPEKYVSGEALSSSLGVTRTAVWKYIKELKAEGYVIDSASKKGYMLVSSPDRLNSCEIGHGLETEVIAGEIYCFDEIDSTNNYAKKLAQEGCPDGTVVTAEKQTAGRGRLGRDWSSPGERGIWMSVVLRPPIHPEQAQLITLGASVAAAKGIKAATGIETGIKWPNDIILNGKKVCGILTEMGCETDRINYLVVGMGINVNQDLEDFPGELRDKATSLKIYNEMNMDGPGTRIRRIDIIRCILKELDVQYSRVKTQMTDEIMDEWKKHSITLGRIVKANIRGTEVTGLAEDITKDGRLMVKSDDGGQYEILSGEISVRGVSGYV